jgi:hypothetical protein
MKRDFGKVLRVGPDGILLQSKAIVPGLTTHDLMLIFEHAKSKASESDRYSGNPSLWPDVRGINAVVEAVLTALDYR